MPIDSGRNSANNKKPSRGFLRRLARDDRGTTLAMIAAGMIPLAAATLLAN